MVYSIFLAAVLGIPLAFMIFAIILNKSNNVGDSRCDERAYSSELTLTSKDDDMKVDPQGLMNYVSTNLQILEQQPDVIACRNASIGANSSELVSRKTH